MSKGSGFKSSVPGHLLFLPRWYPNRSDPMLGLFVRNHAEVAASFAQISVLYVQAVEGIAKSDRHQRKYDIEQVDENSVWTVRVYYQVPRCVLMKKMTGAWRFLRAIMKGYRLIKQRNGQPEMVHVHVLTRMGVIALFLRIFRGIPYVITEHWSRYLPEVDTYHGFIRKIITGMVVRKASAVTTPAKNLRQAMLAHGLKNENYFILPNVVDGERFVPSIEPFYDKNKNAGSTLKQLHEKRVKINETSGRIRFVHVSCFEDRSKNITGILNVLRQLADERNDWECFLVGDGVDREKMIRKAEAMKLCDAVHFTGLLEGHALVEAINSSAFMILFSWYETFSLVIKEAFACGVPVVTTAVGGIPETMNSDRGIMVSPGDEGGLLAGIKWMMEHYPEYDRDKIRDYALMNFSKEAVRQKLEYLYSTASGAR